MASQYRASLYKTFGRLFTAQGRLDEAAKELSQGILLDCLQYGPESIELCSSYYYMGTIFKAMNKVEETRSFFAKSC